ncbi:efflux RND transporter periplasmic adaptor subunit [Lentibacter algarum]|nr:efflux RND transporter periplasmic adaptor subunit [Lentibacter algarum]
MSEDAKQPAKSAKATATKKQTTRAKAKKPAQPTVQADTQAEVQREAQPAPSTETSHQTLSFTDDAGASRSTWIAGILVIAIVAWMGSGFIIPSAEADIQVARQEPKPIAVAVKTSQAETVTQFYQAEGQALPDRDTSLRAETAGDVAEVLVQKGQDVKAGDVIARLDAASNAADVIRAQEELASAQREFDNAEKLLDRGVATADRVSQARAALAGARSQLASAQEDSKALAITAPFTGRIETLDLDVGEYVSSGAEVGRLVDITPLTVAIQVPQQSLTLLKTGQPATVRFITGEEREGKVTFVGTSAASETRTFLTEIEVANDDGAIPAGISAEVIIPTGEARAHFLSPSIVSLNVEGTLGVKTVDADNTVAFYPIEIVKAQIDGIWATGLPDPVNVITIGQGFVNEGETVAPSISEK